MTRDRLLALLRELVSAAEAYNAGYSCVELNAAIDWLEQMPACELVGHTEGASYCPCVVSVR